MMSCSLPGVSRAVASAARIVVQFPPPTPPSQMPLSSLVPVTVKVAAAAGDAVTSTAASVVRRSPFQRMGFLSPRFRGVALALTQDLRCLLDFVTDRHDALGDAGPGVAAAVFDEPSGAADGGRAVLAAGAELAFAVAPELAGLGLLGGGAR